MCHLEAEHFDRMIWKIASEETEILTTETNEQKQLLESWYIVQNTRNRFNRSKANLPSVYVHGLSTAKKRKVSTTADHASSLLLPTSTA